MEHSEPTSAEPTSAALEELRRSEERLRLMIEAVRDYAIFMLDPDGRIVSWNAGAERIKGYRAEEIIGRHFSVFYTDYDRQRGHPDDELRRAIADGRYEEEGWRIRKDGSRFRAIVTITALRNDSGQVIGFTKVTRDITERVMAEQRLRELNEDLERRVEERTTDLIAANRELETFSYSVSHDLRAPLRALDGFSRLLLESAAERLDEQEKDYLRRIRAAAQRMAHLTDAMLMLSRLTRASVHRESLDLTAVARGIAAELRDAEPHREVDVAIAPGLRADADPRLARVVLENLLANAWKFTRRASRASVTVGQDDAGFFVRDNGVGFDPELASKLFLPFQRLHRVKDFEGTGIGLATVQRIVRRHGGDITAESAPGAGAVFHFTFGEVHGGSR